jgi:hypothetical protein
MTQQRNTPYAERRMQRIQTGWRQTTKGVGGGLSGSIKKYESYLEDILGSPIHTTAELQKTAVLGIVQAYILRKV